MHPLHPYPDLPLDPQIMQSSHHLHPYANPAEAYPTGPGAADDNAFAQHNDVQDSGTADGDAAYEMALDHAREDDMRMATERHVRVGDEPMGFVGGEGGRGF